MLEFSDKDFKVVLYITNWKTTIPVDGNKL